MGSRSQKNRPTLCWDCQRAGRSECSWDRKEAKPVEGWEAIPVKINVGADRRVQNVQTYVVINCPLFIPEEREVRVSDEDACRTRGKAVRCIETGVWESRLVAHLKGKTRSCGGRTWEFVDKEDGYGNQRQR